MPLVKIILRRRWRKQCRAINRDVSDIVQSVWFHLLPSLGEHRFASPQHFLRYFLNCAENRIRQEARLRRHLPASAPAVPCDEPSKGGKWSMLESLARRESLAELRSRLSPEDFDLLEQRAADTSWLELARAVGATAASVRGRVARILKRLRGER